MLRGGRHGRGSRDGSGNVSAHTTGTRRRRAADARARLIRPARGQAVSAHICDPNRLPERRRWLGAERTLGTLNALSAPTRTQI
ncbi:protein of unknown function (plasmid) [Streptantibioticus cattleyicolor NRRL 8057 = DSM 46488]|nr:protein of unknown function [Streptantibioticus cattleyicolor NRRL 8057 = DSM 46488]